jgi:hypothetical protein
MFNFKDFNITSDKKGYQGDRIKTDRLINREIIIHEFKIEDSKVELGTKYLIMQISLGDTKHVWWTGGKLLKEDIQKVPPDKFPFKTTIIKENDMLKFT